MKLKQKENHTLELKATNVYSGKMSDLQLYGNDLQGKTYQSQTYVTLNDYQKFLYNRALFGLSVYDEQELKKMRWEKKKRIMKVHKRAQSILNIWKQQIVNACTTNFFLSLFPKTSITQTMVETSNDIDPDFLNVMSFKSLCITRDHIINKLMAETILPSNFYELKLNNIESKIETL
jgi:hypothetical protein